MASSYNLVPLDTDHQFDKEVEAFCFRAAGHAQEANITRKVPKTFREAMAGPDKHKWLEGYSNEFKNMEDHGVWSEQEYDPNIPILNPLVDHRIKEDEYGRPVRHKVRICAQGQHEEISKDKTFSPVANIATARLLIGDAVQKNLTLRHYDSIAAYLNAKLQRPVQLRPPPGYRVKKPGNVLRLHKALYGLKDSGKAWFKALKSLLLLLGFKQNRGDPCLFYWTNGKEYIHILVYVDDYLASTNSDPHLDKIAELINNKFPTKLLGDLRHYLGMIVVRDKAKGTCKIHVATYIHTLLKKFHMDNCNPVSTPAKPNEFFQKADGEDIITSYPFKEVLGALLYISIICRPDITYAVHALALVASAPGKDAIVGIKRVLRYLKGTAQLGIVFTRNHPDFMELSAAADADYASNPYDRHSTSGSIIFKTVHLSSGKPRNSLS